MGLIATSVDDLWRSVEALHDGLGSVKEEIKAMRVENEERRGNV